MNLTDKLNQIFKEYSVGNKEHAYKKFKKIYLKNNKDIKLRYNLAVMQQGLGLLEEAESNYKTLIASSPENKFKINLYNLYISKGLLKNAIEIINTIKSQNKDLIQVNSDKAYLLYLLKNYNESVIECNKILSKDKKNINVFNTLGLCLFFLKKFNESNTILVSALELDPNNIKILNSLGRLHHEQRNSIEAKNYFNKALTINSNSFETLNNIAGFYLEEGEYSKAINYYEKALVLSPNNSVLYNNLAKSFIFIGQISKAKKFCKIAITLDHKNDEFKKTLSIILFKNYDFENAWEYFDGRLGLSDFKNKNSTLDLVKNKIPKNIKIDNSAKILIIREQGVGDEILYGTMYNDLLNKYSNVIIECDERLIPLFKNSFQKKHFRKFVKLGLYSSNFSEIKNFDFIFYAGSLGRVFRRNLESFSKKPYLKKINNYEDLELEKIIMEMKEIKIGISWKSLKNRYSSEKSLELKDFNNILELNNTSIFNLQYGDVADELTNFLNRNNYKIITLSKLDLFNNLSGLANLLSKLDYFITVSNSTAHLAGALGIKTILIKPNSHASFHYWDYEDSKTPWYKSITIISRDSLKDKAFISKLIKS